MEPFDSSQEVSLAWVKAKGRSYELKSAVDTIATLRWENRVGSLATGKAATGRWTFKRVGFFRPHITVREYGADKELATFRRFGRGISKLVFADGRSFDWRSTKIHKREKGFNDKAGNLIIKFRPEFRRLNYQARVEVVPEHWGLPDLPILAMMGWYGLVLEYESRMTAAAAAAAAAA